jgi:hypothetical protein
LLSRAFFETYGLDFEDIIGRRRPVVRGYRFAVRSFLPRIAYAEALLHKKSFPPDNPSSPAFQTFEHNLNEADFTKYWEPYRRTPKFRTHLIAAVIFILPKIGPLALLSIRGPSAATHERYIESLNASTVSLRKLLTAGGKFPSVPNRDLDTGDGVRPGGYPLTDETYSKLLALVTRQPSSQVPVGLRDNILDYYADPAAPISTKSDEKKWAQVQHQLVVLRGMRTIRTPES